MDPMKQVMLEDVLFRGTYLPDEDIFETHFLFGWEYRKKTGSGKPMFFQVGCTQEIGSDFDRSPVTLVIEHENVPSLKLAVSHYWETRGWPLSQRPVYISGLEDVGTQVTSLLEDLHKKILILPEYVVEGSIFCDIHITLHERIGRLIQRLPDYFSKELTTSR